MVEEERVNGRVGGMVYVGVELMLTTPTCVLTRKKQ